ncbi:MFS transporter [Sandaracinobacteroides saxicola]|uniref:MFS transporter n=1 Tax=Sandaracinobacteroides saxicola TaxID=2759707 RepID=A0A7G5IEH1_9SPHN|nr:MFS transporter [Sandaracinobacteroides saxicola]QMW21763.1 MFS transporter [Sandaracinobacteroides saxicola]
MTGFPPARLAWTAVALLAAANILSYLDRIIINLLVGPIQRDLQISDTQFGALQGLAFGLFYTLAAVPLGRLVDSRPRRFIIAGGVFVFSLFSLLSGLARSYTQLFLARIGVGAGEASLVPAAYSLISDLFPPEQLGRAMSAFTMTAFIGIGLAYVAGGTAIGWVSAADWSGVPFLADLEGWHRVFILVALPGLLLAPLLLLLPEPPRTGRTRPDSLPFRQVLAHLHARRAVLVPLFASFAAVTFGSYAAAVWTPAFFIRSFGWSPKEIGLWIGLGYLILGPLGVLVAGRWCDALTARGVTDAPLRVAAWAGLAGGLLSILSPLMPSANLALAVLLLSVPFGTMPFPMAGTAIALITPNELRGQVSASYMLTINAVGLGLGPVIVGLLSDTLFTTPDGVRYSLALVAAVTTPLAFLLLWRGLAAYRAVRG